MSYCMQIELGRSFSGKVHYHVTVIPTTALYHIIHYHLPLADFDAIDAPHAQKMPEEERKTLEGGYFD